MAKPVEQLDQLRLELQLAPRGIPRWRFVGSSTLAAKRDGTWIESIQGKADQVLKFKVECQMDETLEVRVTPHFQLAPQGAVMKLTEQTRWQADQITTLAQLRVERQLAWLATASKGKSSGKGKPAGPPPAVKLMLHSQQAVLKVARQRLDRLQELRQKLEGTVELEVRAVLGE